MSSKRDTAIELYRVMLMFGICLLHAIGNSAEPKVWMQNILASCVVGFVFISGWFGIKFTWMKIAKLYGIGLYCALVYGLVASWGEPQYLLSAAKLGFFKLTHGFWFLHAYALMMCLASNFEVRMVNDEVNGGGGEDYCQLSPLCGYGALGVRCRLSANFCRARRGSMRMAGSRSSVSTWLRGGLG